MLALFSGRGSDVKYDVRASLTNYGQGADMYGAGTGDRAFFLSGLQGTREF